MDSEDQTGVEYPIPDLLGYFVYPPFNPSLPLGKKMGYAKPRLADIIIYKLKLLLINYYY